MSTAKYTTWKDFQASNEAVLECTAIGFCIDRGKMVFEINSEGKRWYCVASESDVSCMYFNPNVPLRSQCDFEYFTMFESGNSSNLLCNW